MGLVLAATEYGTGAPCMTCGVGRCEALAIGAALAPVTPICCDRTVNVLADGGALADAGFVVTLLIAIGTVGAAATALWLGIGAQKTTAAQLRESRMKLTRQVVCLYRGPTDASPAAVTVVNASPEVLTSLVVVVDDARFDQNQQLVTWRWTDAPEGFR